MIPGTMGANKTALDATRQRCFSVVFGRLLAKPAGKG
jgi:hypothetical protein